MTCIMAETLFTVFLRSLLAGGLAGCMVDVALFPLDSLKTRLQAFKKGQKVGYSNPYAGLLSAMVASFPCAATFWATYCTVKWLLGSIGLEASPPLLHLLSAASGSLAASLIRAPFEVIKQQMQLGFYKSMQEGFSSVLQKQGLSGLYTGLQSLILREIPFDVTQFLVYEWLKYSDYGGVQQSLASTLLSGALAGGCAAFITTPIDVVKTRLMTQSKDVYKTVFQSLQLIYKTEGLAGLWSGWGIRILYTTIGGMIFFGTFEVLSPYLTVYL